MADETEVDFCKARSKLSNPRKPESYLICTNDVGHADPRHTACDGQGHVLARWRSETSPIEVWVPGEGVGMSAADDRLTAELERIAERANVAFDWRTGPNENLTRAIAGDVLLLRAALDAVLKLHDGRDCRNCEPGTHRRCRLCEGDWPCPTVQAITRELTERVGND